MKQYISIITIIAVLTGQVEMQAMTPYCRTASNLAAQTLRRGFSSVGKKPVSEMTLHELDIERWETLVKEQEKEGRAKQLEQEAQNKLKLQWQEQVKALRSNNPKTREKALLDLQEEATGDVNELIIAGRYKPTATTSGYAEERVRRMKEITEAQEKEKNQKPDEGCTIQ